VLGNQDLHDKGPGMASVVKPPAYTKLDYQNRAPGSEHESRESVDDSKNRSPGRKPRNRSQSSGNGDDRPKKPKRERSRSPLVKKEREFYPEIGHELLQNIDIVKGKNVQYVRKVIEKKLTLM
jgi:hypothetical protein